MSDEEKQQLEIPGYDITEIDVALGGMPSNTDVDNSPITTPDSTEVADSGTVSEDQSGKVDDSGIVVADSPDDIAQGIANGHAWDKHVDNPDGDLNGQFDSPENFMDTIQDIIEYPDDMKTMDDGRTAWWDDSLGIIVIHDPYSPDKGTAFKPDDGKDYFNKHFKNK